MDYPNVLTGHPTFVPMETPVENLQYPIIIDGGLSNVLEAQGCDLNHKLWSAAIIKGNPEALLQAHYEYAVAGAQIIATASYQASIAGLLEEDYTLEQAEEIIIDSVSLAKKGISQALSEGKISVSPLVAGSIGPYGAYLSDGSEYRGDYTVSDQELREFHERRIELLAKAGCDLLAFETIPSLQEARVLSEMLEKYDIPSWVSFSCRDDSCISDGSSIEEVVALFRQHSSVFTVGVNCTPPRYISELIRKINKACPDKRVVVYPNSGEAFNADTKEWVGVSEPVHFQEMVKEWIALGADLVGGCCRIGPRQIAQASKVI